ncbi:MAG: hypothetical protein M1830_000845 [Pleopsidium flavum]|nr:MAG: hypothetical protein M1830_000845 [Pleopsidium flavum]
MSSAQTSYRTSTLPLSMPGKPPYNAPPQPYSSRISMSPPSVAGSSTNPSAAPSYSNSTTSSSYSGSASGEYESSAGGNGVDLVEMLSDRLNGTFDPLPLDRGLARQAQASGELNAKRRELLELQALAQRRLKGTRANFADGMKAAKEVKRDLDWTQKRVNALKTKTERKYPKEYRTANGLYPAPVDY